MPAEDAGLKWWLFDPSVFKTAARRTFKSISESRRMRLLIRDNPPWPSFQLLGIASDARDSLDLDAPRRTLVTTQWFFPKRRVRRNPWCSNNEAVAL